MQITRENSEHPVAVEIQDLFSKGLLTREKIVERTFWNAALLKDVIDAGSMVALAAYQRFTRGKDVVDVVFAVHIIN